jgi:hypothetical protein
MAITTVKVSDIKNYIKNGGSKNILAEHMGYSTANAIEKWIARRRIPRWAQKRVIEFLNKQGTSNEN